MKLMTFFDRVVDFLAYMAGAAIILMMISISVAVVARPLMDVNLPGITEVNEYLLLYMTFLGTTWVLSRNAHVRVDILLNRLSSTGQALANTVTSTLAVIACSVVTWNAAVTTWDMAKRGVTGIDTLEFPVAPLIGIVALACFLLSIQFSREAYRNLMKIRTSMARSVKP